MKTFRLELNEELHTKFKTKCADKRIAMYEKIIELIEKYVE